MKIFWRTDSKLPMTMIMIHRRNKFRKYTLSERKRLWQKYR